MPSTSTTRPNGVKLKKLKPASPWRTSSLCTTTLGGVATRLSMPLIRPAKASGIIRRAGESCRRAAMLSTTGMKMATTPVELIIEPSPATATISSTSRRASLLPARSLIHSPIR
ncbi:hypothetical protein D3C79_474100 [compost metagenome]